MSVEIFPLDSITLNIKCKALDQFKSLITSSSPSGRERGNNDERLIGAFNVCRLSKSQQHLAHCYEGHGGDVRLCHSRSICRLHSIPPALTSLPDPLPYTRGNRSNPDRLNILKWPEAPRRYRSVQALDTVTGLVDIVEDNWPIEGNRSVDCIYTQVCALLFNYLLAFV